MKLRLLSLAALLAFAIATPAAEIRLSAAASLADALRAISETYEKTSGDKVLLNLGGSNVLARQVEAGAPADLIFTADEATMDGLAQKGLIAPETRRSLLSNALVIVVAAENGAAVSKPQDLTSPAITRLALADPAAVPAGVYARAWLEKSGLWAAVAARVVPTENVRGALAAVEAGNAQAAIVYHTDAAISRRVKIAFAIPPEETPGIRYPVALLQAARAPEAARRFLDHLASPAAAVVFAKFGFVVL